MADWPILSALLIVPLFGAFLILIIRGEKAQAERNIRYVALYTTLVNFVLSIILWRMFEVGAAGFQLVEEYPWIGDSISFKLGVDGISLLLVVLTAFLRRWGLAAPGASVDSSAPSSGGGLT